MILPRGSLPTAILPLDLALGVGGLPRGRIIEIYGPEASGKTTVALSVISEAQKKGGVAAFIDAEHALDPLWAQKLGVNLEELLISQPDTGEQALEIAESLIRSGGVDVLVIDSVAALVPRAEIEGEMGDSTMGLQARLMSQALRKIETLKDGDKVVGSRHRVKIVKNKVSSPFRIAEFEVSSKGISREGGILDVGTEMEIIKKSGAFYRYGDE